MKAPAFAARGLPTPLLGPVEVQRGQGWPWTTERSLCEGSTVAKEDVFKNRPMRTQLDDLVDKAKTPKDVLLAWAEHRGNGNQAANALVRWTQLMLRTNGAFKGQHSKVVTDSRLLDIMGTVSREVRRADSEMGWHCYLPHPPRFVLRFCVCVCVIFSSPGVISVEQHSVVCLAISLDHGPLLL